MDPVLWEDGGERQVPGYVTDLLSERAVAFVDRERTRPFALFLSHKAVHPDVQQQQDGTLDMSTMRGYLLPDRHRDLYNGAQYPMRPNVRPPAEVVADKPVWRDVFARREAHRANQTLAATLRGSAQEEIRKRAAMMASVDEGVGALLEALERRGTRTRRSSSSSATMASSSASTAWRPSAASRTRRASGRRSSSAARRWSRPARASTRWCWPSTSPRRCWSWAAAPRPARAGPLAGAAPERAAAALADALPRRVLQRVGIPVAGGHGIQGDPHGPPQAHSLDPPATASTSSTISSGIRTR